MRLKHMNFIRKNDVSRVWGNEMKIEKRIFDECLIIDPSERKDCRGEMKVFYSKNEFTQIIKNFEIKQMRIYSIPKKNTFFGIHYQSKEKAQGKLINVIQGKGLDYIVDLRPCSKTFKKYVSFELDARSPKLVYIAPGFGHAFLSTEDNTIQLFAIDEFFDKEEKGVISYKDPEIGLKLPVEDIIISDYDREAQKDK